MRFKNGDESSTKLGEAEQESTRRKTLTGGTHGPLQKGGGTALWMMPNTYTPLAVANHFIANFSQMVGIEHMKLQKLVYCAYGWWLTQDYVDPLINERPQIWKYGPVFSSLYHVLKPFGRVPIVRPQSPSPFEPVTIIVDDNIKQFLEWIWNRYGHISSFALSEMTHRTGTSWSRLAKERNYIVPRGLEIPDVYIKEEFKGILREEVGIDIGTIDDDRQQSVN